MMEEAQGSEEVQLLQKPSVKTVTDESVKDGLDVAARVVVKRKWLLCPWALVRLSVPQPQHPQLDPAGAWTR